MKSMTGFGNARAGSKEVNLEVSIRAVNGRYLEPRFHIPRELLSLEVELKKILEKYIKRGTVDIFISRKVKAKSDIADLHVDMGIAKKYINAYKQISKSLKIPLQIHLENLARMPEVMSLQENAQIFSGEDDLLKKTFQSACMAIDQERSREGKALQKELLNLLSLLEKQVSIIAELREEANAHLQERYEQKIRTRISDAEIDPQRLSQEIVIQLEKADINEELVRLAEHIKSYHGLINTKDVEGKKLDFYTQELLREVNTIGSKSQVAKITQAVVEAKTIIERLREQVQNVQ